MANEKKLLHNLKCKKRSALEDVIKSYTPYISVIVYNALGGKASKEDAEEVISDVFFRLWQNAESIDEEKGSIRLYIGAVARNTAKNKLRSLKYADELDEGVMSDADNPQNVLLKSEESQTLINMIIALGEPDSEIFLRYYYYDERIKSISKIMGINTSTVKSKLRRGREKLKQSVTDNGRVGNE